MSTLKVNAIRGTGASADAITVNATDGTCTAKVTNNLSNRNLIINGAMQVAQRGDTTGVQSSYGGADRFGVWSNSDGRVTMNQTTGPALQGFPSCQELDCTTVASSGTYAYLGYRFEGQDLQQLKKGTANAESVTLSFWVYSPKTGTHVIQLYDNDNARHICQAYTVSSANTWEKKTLTFAGDTSGALGNDVNYSLQIYWWLFASSTYTSGTLATSWASFTAANACPGQVNVLDNTANDFKLTGVQLEVGDVATDFEHRTYAHELRACKRYCGLYKSGVAGKNCWWFLVSESAANYGAYVNLDWDEPMRAQPTVTGGDELKLERPQVGYSQRINAFDSITQRSLGYVKWPSSGTYGGSTGISANGGDTYIRMSLAGSDTGAWILASAEL